MLLSAFSDLMFTCNAVLPIIILIVVGYFLKRINLMPEEFWKMSKRFCFRVALPVMLFFNIYNVKSIVDIAHQWKIVLYCVLAILVIFGIGLGCVISFCKDPKQKGVILQCAFRSNFAIIGVSLAESLASGNPEPVALAAVVSAVSIPLFNILAILSLSIFIKNEDGSKTSPKQIAKTIVTNPLIIAVLLGIVVLAIRAMLPNTSIENNMIIRYKVPFVYTSLSWIKNIASPLALIALGGDFVFSAVARLKWQIIFATFARVVIVPAAALITLYWMNKGAGWFGQNAIIFPAMIALFGTPVAVSSVPMAAEMGNDEELAGQLVVWTSILSAFTLFIIVLIARMVGIF